MRPLLVALPLLISMSAVATPHIMDGFLGSSVQQPTLLILIIKLFTSFNVYTASLARDLVFLVDPGAADAAARDGRAARRVGE